eukprot:TRINITY_DN38249_c0_g2_i1.p2 TRINITY_DN38249_c0_g2~~TRINITY_DN38249_c0_g2_i1.p2  ORF type:complete len:126 (+),score=34.03 TRINITY_DN38249_c0_g2_i1:88-465(+)
MVIRPLKVILVAKAMFSTWLGAAATSDDDCLNVEEPGYEGGDRQCFGSDELGMVCGWDDTPEEAYCEISPTGLKVCARRRGLGRCLDGNNSPTTDKKHDKAPDEELTDDHDDYEDEEDEYDGEDL